MYRIIVDYGAYEGMKFLDNEEYDTVDAAVKAAISDSQGSKWIIVTIVDWRAVER